MGPGEELVKRASDCTSTYQPDCASCTEVIMLAIVGFRGTDLIRGKWEQR